MAALAALSLKIAIIREKMLEVGAISQETAKTPQELGVDKWFLTRGIAKLKGIKQTVNGRFYVEVKEAVPLERVERS